MGGCSCIPAANHVSSKAYLSAVLKYKNQIGTLRPLGGGWDLKDYPESIWHSLRKLVATAYALSHGISTQQLEDEALQTYWVHDVRSTVCRLDYATSPSFLISED